MKSKYFFEEFKKEIDDDHKKYKTVQEKTDIHINKCDHKNKVKLIGSELRCKCGAAWSGTNIEALFDLFDKKS